MIISSKRVYLIATMLLLNSCAIDNKREDHQLTIRECESKIDDSEKVNCYSKEMQISINFEISSAIRDTPEFHYFLSQLDPQNRLKIEIELDENGNILNIQATQPTANFRFDNEIIRAIHNAAPFTLPRDKKLRSKLLKFIYIVELS